MLKSCDELTNKVLHYEMHSEINGNLSAVTDFYTKKRSILIEAIDILHHNRTHTQTQNKKYGTFIQFVIYSWLNNHSQPN